MPLEILATRETHGIERDKLKIGNLSAAIEVDGASALDLTEKRFPFSTRQETYFRRKYLVDRICGCLLLLLASPVIALLWCAVKLSSRGPGFYLQERVGLNGRTFRIVKLRTMRHDAEAGGRIQWSHSRDARVTPLGRIFRKLHLDELPQLWNVARGEMSLVGPRPERPEITRSLEKLIPDYNLRHRIKPGVTGLSQINLEPDRHINITRQKQVLDLRYLRHASPWLDALMIFATLLRMFGINGEIVMKMTGLNQTITDEELITVGYQFEAAAEELWNPSKGPA
ncbi:MAG: sugar transferase [Aureliella sp.]